MMKKSIGMVVALVCLAGSALAESRLGPFASWLRNNDADGFGGGVQYQWMYNQNVGVDSRAAYLTSDGESLTALMLGLTGVLPLQGWSVFASAGGGYFIPGNSDGDSPDAALGFYAGGGARLPISENMDFVAEVDYVSAKSEKTETESSFYQFGNYAVYSVRTTTTSMDISGPAASLGVVWKF